MYFVSKIVSLAQEAKIFEEFQSQSALKLYPKVRAWANRDELN